MSENSEMVTCEGHGQQPPSFVCQHLAESQPEDASIGFHWNCEGGDLLANCDACESHAGDDGFLSDDYFEENFVVICRSCFIEMANVNGVSSDAIAEAEASAQTTAD
jgi:hypothetical protein